MSQTIPASPANPMETGEQITSAMIAGWAEEAAERLDGFIVETPLLASETLSSGDAQVAVKDETKQPGGSFKDRGAGNAVLYHATEGEELFVTSSAGNHARGLARAAVTAGVPAIAVVPESASIEKRNGVQQAGAGLIVHGQNFDEALRFGQTLAEERGGKFVHPFADPLVIAGQGTVALELLRQNPDMTHVVVPVGGGGLLAGVASVIKEHKENVQVIASQVEGNTAYVDSVTMGFPLEEQKTDRLFEGLAVGNVHPLTFSLAEKLVDSVVVVAPSDEAHRAAYDFKKEHGTLLEPAGAVSLAAARQLAKAAAGSEVQIVAIGSGGNTTKVFPKWLDARARRFGWNESA